jgi:hypothetical protein
MARSSRRGLDNELKMAGVDSNRDISAAWAAWAALEDPDTNPHNAVEAVGILDTTATDGDDKTTDRVGAAPSGFTGAKCKFHRDKCSECITGQHGK